MKHSQLGSVQPLAALLPTDLYRQLRQAAREAECSMGELVRVALTAYLAQPTSKPEKDGVA